MNESINLDGAIRAHLAWKSKLQLAISERATLDAHMIGRDDVCSLGCWLHGEGRVAYAESPAYRDLLVHHARFHIEAGRVADAINRKDYAHACDLLMQDSPCGQASYAVGTAINRLKAEAGR